MNDPIHDNPTADVPQQVGLAQPQAPSGGEINRTVVNVLRQPTFLIVTVVLLMAAVGLNAAVNFLKLHFKKEPVALTHPLGLIPERLGTWVQVSQDQPLDKEMQDVLGTDKYIFREYLDERVFGLGVAEQFKNKTADERRIEVNKKRAKSSNGVVSLSVTYYTGMVDTVAHVPDRCVTADGYEPKSYKTEKWTIAHDLPANIKKGSDDIEVRYINFEDQTGTSNVPRSISYFFSVNGEFNSSPLGVRQRLADLRERKAYYAKIECMTTMDNTDESKRVMTDFLSAAMPEIQRCLPDWEKVRGNTVEQVAVK